MYVRIATMLSDYRVYWSAPRRANDMIQNVGVKAAGAAAISMHTETALFESIHARL